MGGDYFNRHVIICKMSNVIWYSLSISHSSPSGKFLADNIVGSVVVFSLVFWIPLSILVHCVVRNCSMLF